MLLIQTSSSTLTRTAGMPSPDSRSTCSNSDEPAAARALIESCRQRGASGCCSAGAGFGGLALIDLLSRDLAAGPEPTSRARRQRRLAASGHGAECHFPVHGRWSEPHRHVRSQARAQPSGRQAASTELQTGDHSDGRRPGAAAWPRGENGSNTARAGSGFRTGSRTSRHAPTTWR